MVEALAQQLSASRENGRPSAGPAPSDLREKLVQTDHSELTQVRFALLLWRDLGCRFCDAQSFFNLYLLIGCLFCILHRLQCTETYIWRLWQGLVSWSWMEVLYRTSSSTCRTCGSPWWDLNNDAPRVLIYVANLLSIMFWGTCFWMIYIIVKRMHFPSWFCSEICARFP